MVWIAKEPIDGFNTGDTVPDAKAEIWHQMYKFSPVMKIVAPPTPSFDGPLPSGPVAQPSVVRDDVGSKRKLRK
jgi:hypothetical protein